MPTFRNDGAQVVTHKMTIQSPTDPPRRGLIRFDPGAEVALPYWVPYKELGLTLVSEDPKVPDTILASGTFGFDAGMERKFDIEQCDTYIVNVIVQTGRVMLYPGSTKTGVEIVQDADVPFHYRGVYDWEHAPYLRLVGLDAGTRATVHAEVDRSALVLARGGGAAWAL
ncbi:MAG: hypothetical protein IJR14_01970 [Synergistaceae bacterium]|nr:hypothetical protein [Synergistaceae bacterium]